MHGINFGGLMFTFPVPLQASFTPPDAGLYAVQVADRSFSPMPYQPIYFGQSGRLGEQRLLEHPRYQQWCAHGQAQKGLYVSFFPTGTMPESTRLEFAARLLTQYLQPWDPREQARAAGLRMTED
jgi:hypothetical protein